MKHKYQSITPLFFLPCLLLLFSSIIHAQTTPTDVFYAVKQINLDIESLRVHLKKDKNVQPEMNLSNVSPREVYAQTLTMQLKADQLSFEQLGKRQTLLYQFIEGKITPKHVLAVVNNIQKILLPILTQQGLAITHKTPQTSKAKTPTDVFIFIIQNNRQLNLLLDQKLVPSDVYIRVQESINYAAALHPQFPNIKMPILQPLVKGKTPADVYARLADAFNVIREMLLLSGIKTMEIHKIEASGKIIPSDVYDMASLVHSEIKAAYFNMKKRNFVEGAYYPGPKKPHDVYQQVGLLEDLLLDLLLDQLSEHKQ